MNIPLCRVYEKTSPKGNRYFVGRLGNARILLMRDDKAKGTDPVWEVFVSEIAAQPDKTAQEASGSRRRSWGPRRPSQEAFQRATAAQASLDHSPLDDDLPEWDS